MSAELVALVEGIIIGSATLSGIYLTINDKKAFKQIKEEREINDLITFHREKFLKCNNPYQLAIMHLFALHNLNDQYISCHIISKLTHMGLSSVKKTIPELEKIGFLEVERKKGKMSKYRVKS